MINIKTRFGFLWNFTKRVIYTTKAIIFPEDDSKTVDQFLVIRVIPLLS